MADPFLATDGSKTWLFFEEVPAGTTKGRLSCMEVGVDRVDFSEPAVIMEADHHLSYPCVVSDRREFFLMPESCKTRTIQLFRATRFPFEWQMETNLMEDFPAVDTTPFFLDGRWYFFTTTTEPFMESFLSCADSLGGRWHLHPKSPISSYVPLGRPLVLSKRPSFAPYAGLLGSIRLRNRHKRNHPADHGGVRRTVRGFHRAILAERPSRYSHLELVRIV